jgi:hypothetical protein
MGGIGTVKHACLSQNVSAHPTSKAGRAGVSLGLAPGAIFDPSQLSSQKLRARSFTALPAKMGRILASALAAALCAGSGEAHKGGHGAWRLGKSHHDGGDAGSSVGPHRGPGFGGWHERMEAVHDLLQEQGREFSWAPTVETGRAVMFSATDSGVNVECVAASAEAARPTDVVVVVSREER